MSGIRKLYRLRLYHDFFFFFILQLLPKTNLYNFMTVYQNEKEKSQTN